MNWLEEFFSYCEKEFKKISEKIVIDALASILY